MATASQRQNRQGEKCTTVRLSDRIHPDPRPERPPPGPFPERAEVRQHLPRRHRHGTAAEKIEALVRRRWFSRRCTERGPRKEDRQARCGRFAIFDIYNLLNDNAISNENYTYTTQNSLWLKPQTILPARTFHVSGTLVF